MSVNGIDSYNFMGKMNPIKPIVKDELINAPEAVGEAKGKSFTEFLGDAISSVDNDRKESDNLIQGMLTGEKPVMVHDAMIALEKADVAFNLMNQVRRKIVRAYEEVIRTPV